MREKTSAIYVGRVSETIWKHSAYSAYIRHSTELRNLHVVNQVFEPICCVIMKCLHSRAQGMSSNSEAVARCKYRLQSFRRTALLLSRQYNGERDGISQIEMFKFHYLIH
ncbi:hypothetical protein Naga_100001g161 [Nannochloropsis gaditana]|uniref:Uncharacterized protein n=1 Tax=Nannochloropsis gaditana TaxID=72520 RepID=W7TL07_9STRA|nr:hypothetical protein Naga_100001g161 [Nannochloropsis gaditana]